MTRFRNWWRKFGRSPYIGDLRLIQREYRHLYRERMEKGSCGWALNALFEAYHAGHFRRDSDSRPEGEDSRSEAEGKARQNGDAESGASPITSCNHTPISHPGTPIP